jgi:hypothetical protein
VRITLTQATHTQAKRQHIKKKLSGIKSNLANWEKWFGVRVYDRQKRAATKEHDEIALLYVSSPKSDLAPDWTMDRIWLAGSEEVRGGEAGNLGEALRLSLKEINYCPFCGQELHLSDLISQPIELLSKWKINCRYRQRPPSPTRRNDTFLNCLDRFVLLKKLFH